ncbi:rod shape-determining protein RodA [Pseudochryseolinea flava]|nr:rod shape-determining protein RodA [Pseudochryseolinea flava]
MMQQRREEILTHKVDWVTVLIYCIMVFWGWLNIYSATYDENISLWDNDKAKMQLFFIFGSFLIIGAILIIDMRFYETFSYIIYGTIIFLLILVLLFGHEVGGNKSWLRIGPVGIQPSEFAKFATALVVAKIIGSIGFRMDQLRNQAIVFGAIGLPIIMILLQKDYGSAMVFLIFIVVFYREGMSPFLILVGVGVAVIFILTLVVSNNWILFGIIGVIWGLVIFMNRRKKMKRLIIITVGALTLIGTIVCVDLIFTNLLEPHHQKRIMVLLDPDLDPSGAGYHVNQSKVAIGSGGFFGKGFLDGTQTKFKFVPEQFTDFIFCTIGEEQGWIGSLLIIGLFIGLMLRVIFIAERQKNRFARVYGYAVACIFFFHFATNIAMTIGLFPVIGIPLPFFSYGGSSLWGFTTLLFILLKLDAHRMNVLQRV